VTATDEPLLLEAVVERGMAWEAVRSLRRFADARKRLVAIGAVAAVVAVVAALARQPAVLLAIPVVLGLAWLVGTQVQLNQLLAVALRPGSVIRVEWQERELVVHRPMSTVHYGYDAMELAGTTERLTALWIRGGMDPARRAVLHLPSQLVPPEAVVRIRAAAHLDVDGDPASS